MQFGGIWVLVDASRCWTGMGMGMGMRVRQNTQECLGGKDPPCKHV